MGLKISTPGFFWVGKFEKYFSLCVARFNQGFFRVFKTISRFLVVLTALFVLYHVILSGNF